MIVVVVGAVAMLTVLALWPRSRRFLAVGLLVALGGLLVVPGACALSDTTNPVLNATLPQAGPRGGAAGGTFGSAGFDQTTGDAQLAAWLKAQRNGQRWDLVTASAMNASALEARYDLSVMALGGFLGSDPATTPERFAEQVATGQVRFVMAGGFGGGGLRVPGGGFPNGGGSPFPNGGRVPNGGSPGRGGPLGRGPAQSVLSVAQQVCTPVTSATAGAGFPSSYDGQILDCAGKADDLLVTAALTS